MTLTYKDAVYGTVHDEVIRAASRACKSAEDVCDMGSIATVIHVLTEEIASEQKLMIPAGSQLPQSGTKNKSEAEVELTISDVFIAKIKTKTGVKEVSEEARDVVHQHETVARRLLEANVTLLPIPKSEKKAKEEIMKSAAGKIRGVVGVSGVGVFVDPGVLGEPITAPHNRIPPIPANDVKALAACHRLTLAACMIDDALA